MASDPKLAPQTGNENFRVHIENRTNGILNPLENGSAFKYGDYGSGGRPVSVDKYSSGPVPQAFFVHGTRLLAGVEGYQKYVIDSRVLANLQFNSDYPDQPGDYFYAGLQPRNPGDDATTFYLQVYDVPVPIPIDMKSFSPRVVVWPNEKPYRVNPLGPPSIERDAITLAIKIQNLTNEIMTLNEVKAPLDNFFQPSFAPTILPYDGHGDVYLATVHTEFRLRGGYSPAPADVEAVYNLADGAQVAIAYAAFNSPRDPASGTFSGVNTEGYRFKSSDPQGKSGFSTFQIEFTVTIERV